MARIFILDDEETIIDSLKEFLEESEHLVEWSINAKSALTDLKDFNPDIVFVDIFMPFTSGFEFIKKLRSYDPDVYIIAMTGGHNPFDPKSCLFVAEKDGADIGIPKPLDFDHIFDIINKQLN